MNILTDILFRTLLKSKMHSNSYTSVFPKTSIVIVVGVLDWKEMKAYLKSTISCHATTINFHLTI